ncbi:hypothetical protein NL676_017355 [Syzygium grande]|nr:hypothetical protein NL676_017355 [Syzygium grande]
MKSASQLGEPTLRQLAVGDIPNGLGRCGRAPAPAPANARICWRSYGPQLTEVRPKDIILRTWQRHETRQGHLSKGLRLFHGGLQILWRSLHLLPWVLKKKV